jgi:two-component system LytT family response regulator
MIKAIIIDDEAHCRESLNILLKENCPDISVMDTFSSAKKAMESIIRNPPDLLFLDIEMPGMNGFEMLEKLMPLHFPVIFTTGYDQYAIKAFHYSAIDYLIKPIDPGELKYAIEKLVYQKSRPIPEQFEMLLSKIYKKKVFNKIAIPTAEGFELVAADQVLYFEASNSYTHVTIKNRQKLIACRTLKEMEEQVEDHEYFIRVHNSYIVNLNEVTRYVRGEGGYLVMSDNTTVNVSRSRKDDLLQLF